jgi:hypothetical protein
MDDNLKQTIFETFSEVFETMFFTFLDPQTDLPTANEVDEAGKYVEAKISFSGGQEGVFKLYMPYQLAQNITLNFLGIDEGGLAENQVADTAAETANMAVGSLLGKIDPAGKTILAIPQAQVLKEFSPASLLNDPGLFLFGTDVGMLWVIKA